MRISKVKICNFKNYQYEVVFDLTKDITILHGENGYGKSSFFDAIEWCLTNNIEHFDGSEQDIKKDIINQYTEITSKQVYVSLEFDGNELTRSFKVNGDKIENTQVKLKLKNDTTIKGKRKVEEYFKKDNLESISNNSKYEQIVKRTYILSQNQITDFVTSETSNNRYEALVNIMGLKSMLNETENYKNILKEVKKEKNFLQNETDKHVESIKSLKAAKGSFDFDELRKKTKQLAVNIDNTEKEYDDYRVELLKEKNTLTEFLTNYEKLNVKSIDTSKSLPRQVENKTHFNQKYSNKISKRESALEAIRLRMTSLRKEQSNLEKYITLKNTINNKKNRLKEMNISEDERDKISNDLKKNRFKMLKLEYIQSITPLIIQNKQEMNKAKIENKEILAEIDKFVRRKIKYEIIIKDLKKITDKNKDKVMMQLISSVKNIGAYVEENKIEKCPVCSSTPQNNLSLNIEENVLVLNEKIKEDTLYLDKAMKLLSKIEEKKYIISKNEKKLKSKYSNNELLIERLTTENREYKNNKLYDSTYEELSEKHMKEIIFNNEESIKRLRESIDIIKELNSLYKELGDTKQISEIDNKYEIRSNIDIEKLITRLKNIEKNIVQSVNINILRKEKNEKILSTLKKVISEAQKSKLLLVNSQSLDELNLKAKETLEQNEWELTIIKEILDLLSIRKSNDNIDYQINNSKNKKNVMFNKIKELEKMDTKLATYIGARNTHFGTKTKDFFNKDTSTIQKYFRYLNPIPSNSKLRFDGQEEEIEINIEFDSNNNIIRNAKNTLSSGQLNVLAISIFLAINEEQKVNELDFVAIDDPIQNMDDVNQYSICDILGNIKKQLIFSTHSIDFLKLFIKKNEYRKENIQIYSFSSPYLNQDKVNHLLLD